MVTERDQILSDLKYVDMKLLNHPNADVRHQWANETDRLLGHRSVWDDIDNIPELRAALESADALIHPIPA